MAGFFKKLFNRIAGVKEEAPPPAAPVEFVPAVEETVPPPVEAPQVAEAPVVVEPPPSAPEVQPEPVPTPEPERAVEPAPAEPEPVAEPVEAAPVIATPLVPETVVEETPAPMAKARKPAAKVEPKKPSAVPKKAEAAKPQKAPVAKKEPVAKAPRREASKPQAETKAEAPEKPPGPATAPKPAAPPPVTEKLPEPTPSPEPQPAAPAVAPPPVPVVEAPPPAPPTTIEPAQDAEPVAPATIVPAEPVVPAKAGKLVKPTAPPVAAPQVESAERRGWFSRLREGLSKSSRSISGSISSIFTKKKLDAATLQDLEDVLLQADLGLPMAERIIKAVSAGRFDREIDPEEVKRILAEEVAKVLKPVEVPFNFGSEKPFVILVVGVNGSGKTTTIGKLGAIAAQEGYKVMFAACDTFRAAAIEQLTVWGKRIGAKTMSRPTGSDSSGLAFDAMKEARGDGTDILFIDTAGRLQNKAYLMDELDKVVRVIKKQDQNAPHAVLLVLDATTGQNAMAQADVFTKVAGVTGLIMTKLDGTARGGILVAIAERFKLPVHAIGVGEKIDDLQPFDAEGFARAIAGLDMK